IVCTYKSKTGNDSFETPDFIQHITINNYPNPFNPTTKITYSINCNANVKLDIYNVKGQKVRCLLEETIHKGEHQVVWDGNDDLGKPCPSGIYFCKIQTDKATKLHKMMMIK
ncbi:MAG TPA: T9SS type A sorting domain-containing protein, partial [Candidatus Cloacimonadota bacterium]|nr:T9SS type A sorting domain-containing protein [Candidatus Cloacimonadota bacterium]